MAAKFARKAKAQRLVLTHFSPRYSGAGTRHAAETMSEIAGLARAHFPGPVSTARDFLRVSHLKCSRRLSFAWANETPPFAHRLVRNQIGGLVRNLSASSCLVLQCHRARTVLLLISLLDASVFSLVTTQSAPFPLTCAALPYPVQLRLHPVGLVREIWPPEQPWEMLSWPRPEE